jgi:hypothetical protein
LGTISINPITMAAAPNRNNKPPIDFIIVGFVE